MRIWTITSGSSMAAQLGQCSMSKTRLSSRAQLRRSGAKRFARIKLREAFAPEIAKFSHPERVQPFTSSDILEAAFEKHQAAVNEFRLYLKGNQLDGYDRVGHDYYYAPGNDPLDFSRYFGGIEETKLALARMEAIVAITKS